MDERKVPMEDRLLDPLVFPIGAGPDYGNHFLDAVRELRKRYPEVHIFGGLSNVSFGLPRRKLLNHAFITLAIMAGCDTVMIDPLMNPPMDYVEFRYAAEERQAFIARYGVGEACENCGDIGVTVKIWEKYGSNTCEIGGDIGPDGIIGGIVACDACGDAQTLPRSRILETAV